MATITTEYGKLSSNKTRTVYLRIRSGKTEKRINTQVKVLESEISPRTKKIKDFSKARQIEMMRLDWETKINQLGIEALGVKVDAQDITSAISKKEEETDFFAFAKELVGTHQHQRQEELPMYAQHLFLISWQGESSLF